MPNLNHPGFGKEFLQMSQKAQDTKETHKLDIIKIKNFCASKDTIKKIQTQHINWEKIFANHISDKKLVSIIYKELLQLSDKKPSNSMKKMGKGSK